MSDDRFKETRKLWREGGWRVRVRILVYVPAIILSAWCVAVVFITLIARVAWWVAGTIWW